MNHTLLKQHNCKLNMCELDKIDFDRGDMCQGGVNMIFGS
jgi:hypothetical protein